MSESETLDIAVEIYKKAIIEGMIKAFPETGEVVLDVEVQTPIGLLTFKTRPINPDFVTRIYLGPNRLYKVLMDCRVSRDPNDITKWVEEKLAKPSFVSQVDKVSRL